MYIVERGESRNVPNKPSDYVIRVSIHIQRIAERITILHCNVCARAVSLSTRLPAAGGGAMIGKFEKVVREGDGGLLFVIYSRVQQNAARV